MLRRPTTTTFAVEPTGFAREHGSEHEYRVTRGQRHTAQLQHHLDAASLPVVQSESRYAPLHGRRQVVCQQQSCLPRH